MSPFQGFNDSCIDSQGFALGYLMLPLWGKRLTAICVDTDAVEEYLCRPSSLGREELQSLDW